jgi:hypothetical protein
VTSISVDIEQIIIENESSAPLDASRFGRLTERALARVLQSGSGDAGQFVGPLEETRGAEVGHNLDANEDSVASETAIRVHSSLRDVANRL